jgi:ribonuclease HI
MHAACDKKQGCVGMGVLIRDHIGHVKAARSTTKLGCFEPAVVEAMSLLHGLFLCVEFGLQNVVVEGDAQVVLTTLQEHDLAISWMI